jgi:hypothetical protein
MGESNGEHRELGGKGIRDSSLEVRGRFLKVYYSSYQMSICSTNAQSTFLSVYLASLPASSSSSDSNWYISLLISLLICSSPSSHESY